MKRKNIIGEKFDRLLVIAYGGKSKCRHAVWICQCDCGVIKPIMGKHLRSGHTKSCGCLHSSKETRKKISVNHINVSGKNNPNYKSSITDKERELGRFYPEYKEWRKEVYKRDKYTCQRCGSNKSGNLNAHHIESYAVNPDSRITVGNGVTLCESCHKNFHHQYTYYDNTRKQWEEFNENSV